jgi:hypothetical protein
MEFMSQDLAAFYAPALPGQPAGVQDDEDEGQPPQRFRRVFRLADCTWNLAS